MAELIKIQEDFLSNLIRNIRNFKKSPKERITISYCETRLEALEQQWSLCVDTHRNIVVEINRTEMEEPEYMTQNVYGSIEDHYFEYKSILRDTLNKLNPKDENKSNHNRNPEAKKSHIKLPDITLPKFSGNYSDWVNFRDLFKSLIHQNESLDDVQRLHYLKGSLTGEAETLVKNITITSDNYKICWDRLVSRYDNKRLMANSIIRRLMTQKSLTQESATLVRQLLDTTSECLQALRNMAVKVDSWDLIIIYVVSQKLDPESRAKWEAKLSEAGDELPTYKLLEDFLETRFRALEYKLTNDKGQDKSQAKSSHTAATVTLSCLWCSENHKLCNCKQFSSESVENRRKYVQEQRLCFNCLSPTHSAYKCTVTTSCRLCKKRHHTLLHQKTPPEESRSEQPSDQSSSRARVVAVATDATSPETETEDEENLNPFTSCFSKSRSTVLLATALVNVNAQTKGSSASVLRSLLDQGSQASFITESAAQLLGLRRYREKVKVSGLGEVGNLESRSSIFIQISSRIDTSFTLRVKVHVLDKLTTLLPSSRVSSDNLKALPSLQFADPTFYKPGGIDLLLGAEVYSKILLAGLIQGPNGNFIAQQTRLGWILSGQSEPKLHLGFHASVKVDVVEDDVILKKFWELEAEPMSATKMLSPEEKACEELFQATTKRDEDGRYIVKLPLRKEEPLAAAGGSLDIVQRRFLMLEKRLSKNATLKTEYSKVINEYLAMGHMELCESKSKEGSVYLPHHAVIREDKTTTKVRVVFDASCKGHNGASLNSDLMVGPTLQPDLRHLVMRWRCYPISLVADIVKMYRQVKVAEEDVDYQRILWREDPNDEIEHFRLLRVTFGTASAPYLAVRALQQVAHDEGSEFPLASDRVLHDF